MLDGDHAAVAAAPDEELFERTLDSLECGIVLPAEWRDRLKLKGPLPAKVDDGRRFPRFHYAVRGVLHYRPSLPTLAREPRQFVVVTKDVCREGLGFLHEQQLFPCERLELWLPGGRTGRIEVLRCAKSGTRCYEIGACFV